MSYLNSYIFCAVTALQVAYTYLNPYAFFTTYLQLRAVNIVIR